MSLIYLDHNSTTPLCGEAVAAMTPWQTDSYGNPASQHQAGRRAREALENAREAIGALLGARTNTMQSDRVIFTSGGTEANNLALLGMAAAREAARGPGEAIVSSIEHPSILQAAEYLERRGWTIRRLGATSAGVVDLEPLDTWLHADMAFVSVMLANNETGVLQPVEEIARRCAPLGVPLHTDAVQVAGKLPIDFHALGATSLALAGHKFHGPLGIGVLLTRHDVTLEPQLHGGFQQAGLRPGTESVALAVGLHAALSAWTQQAEERASRIQRLRDRLESGLQAGYAGRLIINGAAAARLPNTSNLAFVGLERQALFMALDLAGIACSTGSACASGSSEPSTVLRAMGCDTAVLESSLRFSLGATTTESDIDEATARIVHVCRAQSMARAAGNAASHAVSARAANR